MKILKQSCPVGTNSLPDGKACQDNLVSVDPLIVSILHVDQNHIVLYRNDYDAQGHHSDDIHNLAKALMSNNTIQAQTLATKLSVTLNATVSLSI